ncbi:hypothetical protein [Micromonospora carbonacea]|uniref:Uncharacterized protein n=1 Tax=Micromonospora carbonacea TaxID=47853 RepID=A0A1C4WZN6_9ACTN|nr:hypothetical protein [Micromonospora carbonacea]SCF01717.1 hypothetical protein GA0070563_104136 [Micromonospora carbonacea]
MGVLGDISFSPGDIMRRLRDLERAVRELAASRRLEAASIGRGGIVIKDGGSLRIVNTDGVSIAWMGAFSDDESGFILRRAGGQLAFGVYGTGTDTGFAAMYDLAGQYIVTDDVASGRGLARPYIPVQVGEVSAPTVTTTSSSFVDVAAGMMSIQHPVLYAYLLVRASDGTTAGEVRLVLDGNPVGSVLSVAAGAYAYASYGPAALPDNSYQYGALRGLTVQARRTAGSGTIGVRVLTVLGLESAHLG